MRLFWFRWFRWFRSIWFKVVGDLELSMRRKTMQIIWVIPFCLLIAVANVATAAADLTGKVVGVHDGDVRREDA